MRRYNYRPDSRNVYKHSSSSIRKIDTAQRNTRKLANMSFKKDDQVETMNDTESDAGSTAKINHNQNSEKNILDSTTQSTEMRTSNFLGAFGRRSS